MNDYGMMLGDSESRRTSGLTKKGEGREGEESRHAVKEWLFTTYIAAFLHLPRTHNPA